MSTTARPPRTVAKLILPDDRSMLIWTLSPPPIRIGIVISSYRAKPIMFERVRINEEGSAIYEVERATGQ